MLKDRIQSDLTAAMKARESLIVETLRMLLAGLKNERISRGKDLTEEEEVAVVKRAVKSRQDSVEMYEKGGRPELAEKERREIEVVSAYLPRQIPEDELCRIVEEIIAELGVSAKKEMGRVMKELMARHPGRVDGRLANKIVAARLA